MLRIATRTTLTPMDWSLLRNAALAIAAWLGVLKLLRQLRGPAAGPSPEHRELANNLLDAVIQVGRLIKRRRQGFGDEQAIQAELDKESDRADELFRRARTEWGPRIDELKSGIVGCTNLFRLATRRMEDARSGKMPDDYKDRNWEEFGDIAGLHSDDESDDFSRQIRAAVDALEAFLAPKIGR